MPTYQAARRNLAVTLKHTGDIAQALREYREVLATPSSDATLYIEYADALRLSEHPMDAVTMYQHALAMLPPTPSETRTHVETQLRRLMSSSRH